MDTRTRSATHKLSLITLALCLGAAGSAGAAPAGKLLPGAEHSPPRVVDESSNGIRLFHIEDGKLEGYGINLGTRIDGVTSEFDRVRLDWKLGGKLVATARCELSMIGKQRARVGCEYKDKPLTAKGSIEAELVYIDDADDTEYLLRRFKVTVAKYPNSGMDVYQLLPDDLLGAAWVRHQYPQDVHDAYGGHVHLFFWIANDNSMSDLKMRCTVNGAKLPDIKLSLNSSDVSSIEAASYPKNGKGATYRWTQIDAVADVYFGVTADYGTAAEGHGFFMLGDHPGAWVCLIRYEGTGLRELAFTVTDKGLITSDLQTAKDAAKTFDNLSAVELRFPKDSKIDGRIRPDAMKKSRGFGLPWPEAPSVKAVQATYPAASGWPDPK